MRLSGEKEESERGILAVFSMLSVLGLSPLSGAWGQKKEEEDLSSLVEALIEKREEARKEKDFEKADSIRDLLKGCGIGLEDKKGSTSWRRINTDEGIN